jgi:hypothetical protein
VEPAEPVEPEPVVLEPVELEPGREDIEPDVEPVAGIIVAVTCTL